MTTSKTHASSVPTGSSWMNRFRRAASQQLESGRGNHVQIREFSDHILRDLGILEGRSPRGYIRSSSIESLTGDRFNGSR